MGYLGQFNEDYEPKHYDELMAMEKEKLVSLIIMWQQYGTRTKNDAVFYAEQVVKLRKMADKFKQLSIN